MALLQQAAEPTYTPLGHAIEVLQGAFRESLLRILQTGLPTAKDEAYRFAKLQPLFQADLALPEHLHDIEYVQLPFLGYKLHPEQVYTLRCINGKYVAHTNEPLTRLPSGILYGSTSQALKEVPNLILPYLQKQESDSLEQITTLLAQDGFFLYVPENVIADKPFNITQIAQGPQNLFINQRNLIILEKGAQANCNISEHTLSEARFVANTSLHTHLAEGAQLSLMILQDVHNKAAILNHLHVALDTTAHFRSNTITLRGGFVRNATTAKLNGEHANLNLTGIALVDNKQYVDTITRVEHKVPHGTSSQLFKTLVDQGGEFSFFGHIHVHREAQKTQAYQRNANVLVSDGGLIHTRPQLIIDADDVKCSHGATVGHLDEEAKFYMLTRGIPQQEVTRLLMRAFLQDVLSEIPHPAIQEQIESLIEARLKGEKE